MKNRFFLYFTASIFTLFCGPKTDQGKPEKDLRLCLVTAIVSEKNPSIPDHSSLGQLTTAEHIALCDYIYKK